MNTLQHGEPKQRRRWATGALVLLSTALAIVSACTQPDSAPSSVRPSATSAAASGASPPSAVATGRPLVPALDGPTLPREFRGLWVASVANIDWPSRRDLTYAQQVAEMDALLDLASRLHFNAIVLQVRPSCDALYVSSLEPTSEYLSGRSGQSVPGAPPGYDPLQRWIDGAHARGMQLHAWFNPFRARHHDAKSPDAPGHVTRRHPEWVRSYDRALWLDPGEPAARAYSLAVILDVVRRYDLDGVHIDDYFYPYPVAGKAFPDDATYNAYVRACAPGVRALSRSDWRRSNVDSFVRDLYAQVKQAKPWVLVGISPFGIWRPGYPAGVKGLDAYEALAADAKKWLNEGWLDYCAPQLYWPTRSAQQPFEPLLRWWMNENRAGRHLWPGLNASATLSSSKSMSAGEIIEQIDLARRTGATGAILYSASALQESRSGLASALSSPLAQPALVPASGWLAGAAPLVPPPTIQRASGGVTLTPPPGADVQVILLASRDARDPRGAWSVAVVPKGSGPVQPPQVPGSMSDNVRVQAACVDRYGRVGPWGQ